MASKLRYKLNLVEIFNRAYAGTELDRKNQLRGFLSEPSVKLNYGQAVIDRIVERTESSIDKKGDSFPGYSQSYKDSLVFQIYGKSGKVNLTLTGAMLSNMIPRPKVVKREVVIEFLSKLQNDKAHGHTTGATGRLPVRDFFGLPPEEEEAILKRIIKDAASTNIIGFAEEFLRDGAVRGRVGDQTLTIPGV